jgi:hypothetical protein
MVGPSLLLLTNLSNTGDIFDVSIYRDAGQVAVVLGVVVVCISRSDHPASNEDECSGHSQSKDDTEILPEVFHLLDLIHLCDLREG